jgi:hypothetical protein
MEGKFVNFGGEKYRIVKWETNLVETDRRNETLEERLRRMCNTGQFFGYSPTADVYCIPNEANPIIAQNML